MAKAHQRVFAFIGALLFLATSVAVSGVVVWQVRQQNKVQKELESAESAQQTEPQQDLKCSGTATQNQPKEGQLQGTKLDNFTPTDSIPKLECIDIVVGTGETVKAGDTITAHYTGAVAKDGTIFQSSHDGPNQPVTFSLGGVIKGWTDGVPGMKVGGTRRLLIPADLAYGANAPQGSGIPADADLVFDIELVKIGR
jgi:FKBP-type peptidyl-prolyl cis-trans isomerase